MNNLISKIVVIGLGTIGRRHLTLINKLQPNTEIAVLTSQNMKEFRKMSLVELKNLDEVGEFNPQIAIISNAASAHVVTAQKLTELKIDFFIEKPLSTTSKGVIELIKTCKFNNTIVSVGYNLRFLPSLRYFKSQIDSGLIGKIYSIRSEVGQYLPEWRPNIDYRTSVSSQAELGGGVLLELSHEIDYLSWIFGNILWTRATLTKQSDLDLNVEDHANLVLGIKQSGNKKVVLASLNMDFIRRDPTRTCTAIGEKGTLRWDGIKNIVELYKSPEAGWVDVYKDKNDVSHSYELQWKSFIDSVADRKNPQVSLEDGLKVLEVIEACRESAINGGQVMVKYSS